MPTHAPFTLPRSLVHYTSVTTQHKLLIHWAPGTDAALAATNAAAIVAQLKTISTAQCTFDGHEYAVAGSNVYNPTTWTNVVGTFTGTRSAAGRASYYGFVGRTAGGCRGKFWLYTCPDGLDTSYRFLPGEFTAGTTLLTWLNSTSNPMVARDGLAIVFKSYINQGVNYHWARKMRAGT
jgi:hypothetical protein